MSMPVTLRTGSHFLCPGQGTVLFLGPMTGRNGSADRASHGSQEKNRRQPRRVARVTGPDCARAHRARTLG